jgi:hypothetical protein
VRAASSSCLASLDCCCCWLLLLLVLFIVLSDSRFLLLLWFCMLEVSLSVLPVNFANLSVLGLLASYKNQYWLFFPLTDEYLFLQWQYESGYRAEESTRLHANTGPLGLKLKQVIYSIKTWFNFLKINLK